MTKKQQQEPNPETAGPEAAALDNEAGTPPVPPFPPEEVSEAVSIAPTSAPPDAEGLAETVRRSAQSMKDRELAPLYTELAQARAELASLRTAFEERERGAALETREAVERQTWGDNPEVREFQTERREVSQRQAALTAEMQQHQNVAETLHAAAKRNDAIALAFKHGLLKGERVIEQVEDFVDYLLAAETPAEMSLMAQVKGVEMRATAAAPKRVAKIDSSLRGGPDEHKGCQVLLTDSSTQNEGEAAIVTLYATDHTLTFTPAVSAATVSGESYELWRDYTLAEVNQALNQAIGEAAIAHLVAHEDHTVVTTGGVLEYDLPPLLAALCAVDYATGDATSVAVDNCETAWSAAANVTATADATIPRQGSYCAKLVLADAAVAGATLATHDLAATVDLSSCDELVFWIHSSVDLSRGDLEIMLDDSAACASPLETLAVPATAAGAWTRHAVRLTNASNDSAIASVGVKFASGVDKGATTLYLDQIEALATATLEYRRLAPVYWSVLRGGQPRLRLDASGLAITGASTRLRLSGYRLPQLLCADADVAESDPEYITAAATGRLLAMRTRHIEGAGAGRWALAHDWLDRAAARRSAVSTALRPNTRWL